ncbi:DUF6879 family protein [Streptomyces xinghaiensis]|uniref:DUF6879 family protein n=1 Tax=Streptomyces xinghaiensis TaxID=1038928 RepID=UPI00343E5C51
MREIFGGAHGTRLEQAAYTPDFMERFRRIGAEGFWKLERMQHYDEGDFPSWLAFRDGEWERSLRLIEELRPEYEEEFGKITGSGIGLHRVRIVERPVTPYIQWELNILHVKQEYGDSEQVRPLAGAPAPAKSPVTSKPVPPRVCGERRARTAGSRPDRSPVGRGSVCRTG